jgi:hypothetical protein
MQQDFDGQQQQSYEAGGQFPSHLQQQQQQHDYQQQQELLQTDDQQAQLQLMQQQGLLQDQLLQQQEALQQQQQQQVWYQLDARGKIDNFDEDDWFVPEEVPFKRRQNVSSTMAASRPHPWKRVRHHIAAENYHELPIDTPTYVSLEAPPPLYPPKRYCDVTGRGGKAGWVGGISCAAVCCMTHNWSLEAHARCMEQGTSPAVLAVLPVNFWKYQLFVSQNHGVLGV